MGKIYQDLSASAFASNTQGLVFSDYNSEWSHPYRVFHPSKMVLGHQDVDLDSGRATSGTMIRKRKGSKVQLQLTFPPMTTAQMAAVLRAVSTFGTITDSGFEGTQSFFQVTYTDPRAGVASNNYRVTKWFYAGDRSAPCYSEELGLWEEMTVDLVER